MIIDGPPGSGKTYMVRGMVHDIPRAQFMVVPSSMAQALDGPEMLGMLLDHVGGK